MLSVSMGVAMKTEPIGICDQCRGEIPQGNWYTTKRKPRLYCCRECLNTANSRNGNEKRTAKRIQAVREGRWKNPHLIKPPTAEEQSRRARKGRLREVKEGRWRNPALTAEARQKLSRPRKHSGALHRAIEKLGQGMSVSQLTEEEAEAHRQYRRELAAQKRAAKNKAP